MTFNGGMLETMFTSKVKYSIVFIECKGFALTCLQPKFLNLAKNWKIGCQRKGNILDRDKKTNAFSYLFTFLQAHALFCVCCFFWTRPLLFNLLGGCCGSALLQFLHFSILPSPLLPPSLKAKSQIAIVGHCRRHFSACLPVLIWERPLYLG